MITAHIALFGISMRPTVALLNDAVGGCTTTVTRFADELLTGVVVGGAQCRHLLPLLIVNESAEDICGDLADD